MLLAVLAIFLFALYFAQKGHIEYLWLALHELLQAPIGFIELAGSSARLDSLWYAALVLQLVLVSAYLFFEFLVAFLSLRRRWYIAWLRYTAPILAGVGPMLLLVGRSSAVGVLLASIFFCCILWMIGWSIFIFGNLIAAALQAQLRGGSLPYSPHLQSHRFRRTIITSAISDETGAALPVLRSRSRPDKFPFTLPPSATSPESWSSSSSSSSASCVFSATRSVSTNELAAARTVQELLIPQEKPSTPGFEVDSVYSPANEVGGDFFHIKTVGFEGLLVVIGDVAGKGLKAAMNVSLLMGALRSTQERGPAKILESLNGVLTGTESFTTCQAIWFGVNGEMVIANAGHLPPWLNSQEISLPGGLPLGVIADVSYEEARFYIHPGDRVLLLSDGVVEARRPSGELFGFDRLHHFSQQSAFYLAEAAKSFGQQDDITVLTVRRLAQAMAA